MTKDEALKMAIELTERFLEHDSISSSDYIDVRNACIKALEPTVAELNDEYLRDTYVEGLSTQEPMTHVIGIDNDGKEVVVKLQSPLYTHPVVKDSLTTQEPMIIKQDNGMVLKIGYDDLPNGTPFYTHPKQWQTLSDYEIFKIEGLDCVDEEYIKHFARAIEAKLREKNT